MDGRNRSIDIIWIERFGKTIKYEYIYHLAPEKDCSYIFDEITGFTENYNYNRD